MNRENFKAFRNFLINANRQNLRIIEIFHNLNELFHKVENELVHLKPTVTSENYQSHIDSLIYDLNRIGDENPSNNLKINKWLKKLKTSKDEFLSWHNVIPANNKLYIILDTNLEMHAKISYPNEIKYSTLNNYTYQDIQEIQYDFEEFIKSFYIKKLNDYLIAQQKKSTKKVKEEKSPKFIDYFNPPYKNYTFLNFLKDTFYTNSKLKGKGFAIMTYLLNKNKCINFIGDFKTYIKTWYDFIEIAYTENESFEGTSKHLKIDVDENSYKVIVKIIEFKLITYQDADLQILNNLLIEEIDKIKTDSKLIG